MTFEVILNEAVALLQRQGRVAYQALKRQFDLDDEALADLKEAMLYAYPQVSDDPGRGLFWTEVPTASEPDGQRGFEAESRFQALLAAVMWWLQRERRVTYRTLKHLLGLDEALLHEMRRELRFRRLAIDEHGEGLVWIGEAYPPEPLTIPVSRQQVTTDAGISISPVSTPTASAASPAQTPSALESAVSPAQTASAMPLQPVAEPVRSAPEAERRQLTVMFYDLADSTKLSQQLDPEDLREVIRAYQHTSAEAIQRLDSYIAQHLGDGLLIYFGWPRAHEHEDDAHRALLAGLGIVEAMTTTLNPRLEAEKGVRLSVRLGIHTGPVVVDEMGGGGRYEHLATGETVNIAARLEGLAQPNTVVMSSVTARLAKRAFALEDLGVQTLKGVTEPMQVFRVLGTMEYPEDDIHTAGSPFLVGRDEEVRLLLRRWEQSKEGHGQAVLIQGDAGIGKSSLVTMVRHHVVESGYTRITLRCSPHYTNSALHPMIEHVRRVLQLQPGETPASRLDKLERALQMSSRPLDELVPLFAALLSIPLPEGRYPALTLPPQQLRQQIQDALVGWIMEEAERRPHIAVWEDVHWADHSTLEMLDIILEQMPMVPMLHVLTFRPDFTPPWSMRSHMTPITLNRLERPQVEALITHLARGKTLPVEVVQHIVAKTDGVPLYVEELTKMLLASDLIRQEGDHYELTGPLLTIAIPDTLQDSLMARLDQLNTAKEVAQLGSVLGREFAYEMLQGLTSQDEETLQTSLSQLVRAELLYQRGRPPRAAYMFKHALIQDAAYASLLRGTRQHVHQQIAQLFESRFPETIETQPELVAHHYTTGGLNEPAVGLWYKAAQHAGERWAYTEAIHHCHKGLEVLSTLPKTPRRLQHELDIQITLGSALMAIKGQTAPDVSQAFARARALCQVVGETPQLFPTLGGFCGFYAVRSELQTARELGEQLLTIAQHQQDSIRLIHANQALGGILYHLGELAPACTHLKHGINLYRAQPHRFRATSGDDLG